VRRPSAITLFTHASDGEVVPAVARLLDAADEAGVEVRVAREEAAKHGIEERPGVVLGADPGGDTDVAVVLGGDGTILAALRTFEGRDVPVFSVNFGAIGFLATVERTEIDEGLRRVIEGDFETLRLPALEAEVEGETRLAVNDVSFHRRPTDRVAELAYSVEGEQLGRVRCDGLVASTPAGSTGYNLANGGPVLAWGVEGFVVSFIAPHTLTARALVVATESALQVQNLSERDAVDVTTDGRIVWALEPLAEMEVRFRRERVLLAQLPGTSFYHRLREKFGRLAY
jgi:NAD+ kinase